jgi:hypothetical protein
MSPGYWWSIGGLSLDIVGASLLAVEAVKLENVRKLVDLLKNRALLPLESPLIVVPGQEKNAAVLEEVNSVDNRRRGFGGREALYIGAHVVAGWALVAAVLWIVYILASRIFHYDLVERNSDFLAQWPVWIVVIAAALIFVITLPIVWLFLGEWVIHGILERAVKGGMQLLVSIDRNTPNGTIGIIGFMFMFAGFVGQIAATIANG